MWYVYLELLHDIPQMKVFIYDSFVSCPVGSVKIASCSSPVSHFIALRSLEKFTFWGGVKSKYACFFSLL